MRHAVAGLAVVEAFVFDLPATPGKAIEKTAIDPMEREVREPVRLDDGAIGCVLPLAELAHRRPPQRLQRVEVVPSQSSMRVPGPRA